MENKKAVRFPGLDGLRFIASVMVICTHIELMKARFSYPNSWDEPFFFYAGGYGVDFFFVLSGFLITYLLLSEKGIKKDININNFYLRRSFRILPLYYLILILTFFVIPNIEALSIPTQTDSFLNNHYWHRFTLFLLVLPHVSKSIFSFVPYGGILWSIGVENQFYLFWPWLVKCSKNIFSSLIVFVAACILLKGLALAAFLVFPNVVAIRYLKTFMAMSRFECMGIGALGAALYYFESSKWLSVIYSRPLLFFCLFLLLPMMYFFPSSVDDAIHLTLSPIFLVIIMNVACNTRSFLKLEHPVLNYLGKISYGIYMYHFIVIGAVLKLLTSFHQSNSVGYWSWNILLYTLVFVITLVLSALSYTYFEKPFLKMRLRFSVLRISAVK